VYRRGARRSVVARLADGTSVEGVDGALDAEVSARVFRRTGEVVRIDVELPAR